MPRRNSNQKGFLFLFFYYTVYVSDISEENHLCSKVFCEKEQLRKIFDIELCFVTFVLSHIFSYGRFMEILRKKDAEKWINN